MNTKFENLDPTEKDIAEYLFKYHKGIENAVSNKRLAEAVGLEERTLREIISKLITVNHITIGSCSVNHSGIYLCNSDEDFKIAHDELIGRMKKLSGRAKGLRIGWQDWKNEIKAEQLQLCGGNDN